MAKALLFSIASVQLALNKSKPPQLAVVVHGYAVSTGWTNPALAPQEKKLSADGILDLDFVADPPDTIDLPALTPQTAELVWKDDVDRLIGVRVVSRTGAVIQLLTRDGAAAGSPDKTTQIAGEAQHPDAAAAATTMALGEEGVPPITTMAVGEEATQIAGETGGGTIFTTFVVGEEGGTTAPWFEEMMPGPVIPPGAAPRAPVTTMVVGEEDLATTHLLGEEGTGLPPTQVVGEAHPGHTTAPHLEEVHTDIDAESTVDPGTTTAPRIEEVADVGAFQNRAAAAGLSHAPMTTLALGEEAGGGGTIFTTLMVGEEGTTTMLGEEHGGWPPTTSMLGEEHGGWPPTTHLLGEEGPSPPGTTAPLIEETTQVAGEAWYDPQNMNPLGRR